MAKYDDQGREIPDNTPVAVPAGWARPPTIEELIRRHIRVEMSRQAADQGMESFEEADDFEVDEDGDPLSPYEIPEGLPEALGGGESIEGSLPPVQDEKTPVEPKNPVSADLRNSGQSSPSTDSSTVTPPAGGSSRS